MWLNVFCAHASVIVCVLFGPLHIRSRVVSVSHRGECVASVCVCIWVCVCRSFFPLRHTVVRHCIGNINFEYQAQLFIRNTYNHTSKRLERAKKKIISFAQQFISHPVFVVFLFGLVRIYLSLIKLTKYLTSETNK